MKDKNESIKRKNALSIKNYFKGKFSKINLVEPTLRWAERNGYFLFDGIRDVGFTESNIAIIDKGDIAYRILDTADSKRFKLEFESWLEFMNTATFEIIQEHPDLSADERKKFEAKMRDYIKKHRGRYGL